MKLITAKLEAFFWASFSLNLLFVLFFIGKRYYYSYGPGARKGVNYNAWNDMRNSLLSTLPIDSNDVVFVGNSITEGFPVTELYGPDVKNRGIGGNTTIQVFNRIDPIANSKPKKVILEIGVNDLFAGISVDSVFENYIAIINRIKSISSNTEVIAQSIFPTCMDYGNLLPKIKRLNNKIEEYCNRNKVTFINIFPDMMHNNSLDSSLTEDGIHLNAKGYAVWGKRIQSSIN